MFSRVSENKVSHPARFALLVTLALAQACTSPVVRPLDVSPTPTLPPPVSPVAVAKPEPPVACDPVSETARGARRAQFKLVTGPERETDIEIGRDLARFVAPCAGIRIEVLSSKGSTENMHRLHADPNVKLAIVNSDVYQSFVGMAAAGNNKAARIVRATRPLMPLYSEEIYFVARSDSALQAIHDIADIRINLGPIGSGSVLSVSALYRRMFSNPIPVANASFLGDEEALIALTFTRTIDVMVVIAGQPAKLFADMKPEARDLIKLLRYEPHASATRALPQPYAPAVIRSTSYPTWLSKDVPTLSVMSMLVASKNKDRKSVDRLNAFTRSLCQNIDILRAHGHSKWREVELDDKVKVASYRTPGGKIESNRCASRPVLARR